MRSLQTEPCPAGAHHCIGCRRAIAAGAPVLDFGSHGYQHYPSCDGAVSSAAVSSVGALAPRFAGAQTAVTDIGDAVADELDRQLGRDPAQTRIRANIMPSSLDQYLAECEALGARNPVTGLRPNQDLGDATAERMAEMQRGYR